MIQLIKNVLMSLLGFSNYRNILVNLMRIKGNIHSKKYKNEDVIECEEFSIKNRDCFFGYYDLNSMNIKKTKLLSLVIDGDIADIGYFERDSKKFCKISETNAWNWQMGARLRWYEDDKSVLFNDYDGEKYISRVVNINGVEEQRFAFPIYDLDKVKRIGYFTDFTILHHLREGYGYSNKCVDFEAYYKNTINGVFMASLDSGRVDTLITIEEMRAITPIPSMKDKYHYVNHISVNPINGDVMFFHLWTNGGNVWNNRMFFMTSQKVLINVIDDFDRASHYSWKDDSHILVTLNIEKRVEYRLYNYRTKEYQLIDFINTDGHPTFVSNDCFITDTYANHYGMQSVYFCSMDKKKVKNLYSIYHSPRIFGVHRCDLHPRVEGDFINIDAIANEYRSQYILRVRKKSEMSKFWVDKIVLDTIAENRNSVSKSLCWCIKSEYLFSTGRKKANWLKILYCFFISSPFRVNSYISWMQHSKSKFKRRLIRNHLEVKYALVIDENCVIGSHFRVDHPVGVVIGPGVRVGDFVKVYQNVTLGKKNGKFPFIGNNVTIYAGAVIIGGVTVGDNSVIGANSVVLQDIPCNSVAVGVPAKIITYKSNE